MIGWMEVSLRRLRPRSGSRRIDTTRTIRKKTASRRMTGSRDEDFLAGSSGEDGGGSSLIDLNVRRMVCDFESANVQVQVGKSLSLSKPQHPGRSGNFESEAEIQGVAPLRRAICSRQSLRLMLWRAR